MYVRAEYRRRGIGTRLVQTLINHSASSGVRAVELWTAEEGPGRFLYERLGFRQISIPGEEFAEVAPDMPHKPGEIRLRLDLA